MGCIFEKNSLWNVRQAIFQFFNLPIFCNRDDPKHRGRKSEFSWNPRKISLFCIASFLCCGYAMPTLYYLLMHEEAELTFSTMIFFGNTINDYLFFRDFDELYFYFCSFRWYFTSFCSALSICVSGFTLVPSYFFCENEVCILRHLVFTYRIYLLKVNFYKNQKRVPNKKNCWRRIWQVLIGCV